MWVIKDTNDMKRKRKSIGWRRRSGGVPHETAAAALLGRWVRDSSTADLLRGPRLAGSLVELEPLQPSTAPLTRALPHTWFTKLLICSWQWQGETIVKKVTKVSTLVLVNPFGSLIVSAFSKLWMQFSKVVTPNNEVILQKKKSSVKGLFSLCESYWLTLDFFDIYTN